MYWVASRNAVVIVPRLRSVTFLLHRRFSPPVTRPRFQAPFAIKERNLYANTIKKCRQLKTEITEKDYTHIKWWKEKMQLCKKPSSLVLVNRLSFSNLLGLDTTLKSGSLKEGTLNWEVLQFKAKFPREVLLCRVGEFYEAIGFDACILVEYAGLNPFGGLRSDSIPKAGCPVVNLRQTLDDLTRNGFSVCIVEEVQGPTQARTRKSRFISGHAHPGSPYVFGLVADDYDLDFPDLMPVVGISRSAKGYCMVSVLETMKTYSVEDGLTEEALVTKMRTCRCHHLLLHGSLRDNSSGTCRWGEYGEGGLLWGECNARQFEWFDGNPVNELLCKVKELYGLEDGTTFRDVTVNVGLDNRPNPLHLGTATQIGALPTEGIPCLLKVLLPSNFSGLPVMYIRDLILNPPPYEIASPIQEACKLLSNIQCSIPEFACVPPAKLVKLLESKETNHIEFCKIKSILDDICQLYTNSELKEILKLLMDPTWMSTGLKVDLQTLVTECEAVASRIAEIISLNGENDQNISSYPIIPNEFFEDMESSWKGRVKRKHLEEEFAEVAAAAEALSVAVQQDFYPIISRIRATTAPLGGPKGEILYAREHEAVWFKGKRFIPNVWAGTPGEEQIKRLRSAFDSKGKKVGEEWFTTENVEEALTRYHIAGEKAKTKVIELLRGLSAELQTSINILVFSSMLLIIAKALFGIVSEGRRRKWVFPTLIQNHKSELGVHEAQRMKIDGLFPYWFDAAHGNAVCNTIDMNSLILLTGPNGGGKSSLLRSICAAALLGICGLMVPAKSAHFPHFDSIMLHMKSYDSPADGKSSFQVEMSETRSIIRRATSRSLVLIDEICRGTETAKGTCIAGSLIETLDASGCLGIVSTHLHGIFDLPLRTRNVVFKAMGTECVDNQTIPTWKLTDGICRESLAFETAKREGVPDEVIERAKDLYSSAYAVYSSPEQRDPKFNPSASPSPDADDPEKDGSLGASQSVDFHKEVETALISVCQRRLSEVYKHSPLKCVVIGAKAQPPPSTIGASCVYIMLRPDRKIYVGETDDLQGRVRSHRAKEGLQGAEFVYLVVPGKSVACEMETLLINQLPGRGFRLTNVADGRHRNFGSFQSFETQMLMR